MNNFEGIHNYLNTLTELTITEKELRSNIETYWQDADTMNEYTEDQLCQLSSDYT